MLDEHTQQSGLKRVREMHASSGHVPSGSSVGYRAVNVLRNHVESLEQTVAWPTRKRVYAPCANRALIDRLQPIWVNFEREADSPNC